MGDCEAARQPTTRGARSQGKRYYLAEYGSDAVRRGGLAQAAQHGAQAVHVQRAEGVGEAPVVREQQVVQAGAGAGAPGLWNEGIKEAEGMKEE